MLAKAALAVGSIIAKEVNIFDPSKTTYDVRNLYMAFIFSSLIKITPIACSNLNT
jgi:hypothetical protein